MIAFAKKMMLGTIDKRLKAEFESYRELSKLDQAKVTEKVYNHIQKNGIPANPDEDVIRKELEEIIQQVKTGR